LRNDLGVERSSAFAHPPDRVDEVADVCDSILQ
jgi:hypothetical protein